MWDAPLWSTKREVKGPMFSPLSIALIALFGFHTLKNQGDPPIASKDAAIEITAAMTIILCHLIIRSFFYCSSMAHLKPMSMRVCQSACAERVSVGCLKCREVVLPNS